MRGFSFFRLVDPSHPKAAALRRRVSELKGAQLQDGTLEAEDLTLLEAAMAHDAFLVLSETVASLAGVGLPLLATSNASCALEQPWELGATVFNYLNAAATEGITGKIKFKVGINFAAFIRGSHLCHQNKRGLYA